MSGSIDSAVDAPTGHLLAQRHALALADVRVALQVLRLRDAPAAPAHARRGRAPARRRRAAQGQGAARAHGRRSGAPPRRARAARRARLRRLRGLRRLVLRARAGARAAPAHEPRRARPRRPRAAAGGDREPGADARVAARRPRGAPGVADEGPGAAAADHAGRRGAADPLDERHPRRHRGDRGGPDGRARGACRVLEPAGGDPPELRAAPAVLRRGAGGDRHGRGGALLAYRPPRRPRRAGPRLGVAGHGGRHGAPRARGAAAAAGGRDPDPAEPGGLVAAACGRRRDRPRRAERQRRPHLARASVPVAVDRAQAARARRPDTVARARDGHALAADELTALFAETRPAVIEDMRQAADELRAELAGETVTFVVNRNINVSNICVVGCAFCGFGQGRRSPDAYQHDEQELRGRVRDAVAYGATEICMQSGIHPDWSLADYERWLRIVQDEAPGIHLHAYSPMEIDAMAGERPLADVFERLRDAGLGSVPGTAAEVLDDGVRERISPNKLPAGRWVEIVEAAHRAGLRSTVTVMFGHIEEPHELAEHMRVVRALQERTGGFTEFVPLSFIPFNTLLGRTHGIEEISRAENLKHTAAFRLALGRSVRSLQASWVKMGLEAATESLRWGVNDLGGTLMEESISRMAGSYHGVRLEPADLIGAAHAAGRPAAERTTLYDIRERYDLAAAA